jgi:hypothetical protein
MYYHWLANGVLCKVKTAYYCLHQCVSALRIALLRQAHAVDSDELRSISQP